MTFLEQEIQIVDKGEVTEPMSPQDKATLMARRRALLEVYRYLLALRSRKLAESAHISTMEKLEGMEP